MIQILNSHISSEIMMEALAVLGDGLCYIRQNSMRHPSRAEKMADILHNIPEILSGQKKSDQEEYLKSLISEAKLLLA